MKKLNLKKFLAVACSITTLTSLSTLDANAISERGLSKTVKNNFSQEWDSGVLDVTYLYGTIVGQWQYGYDTDWINEDYCYVYGTHYLADACVYQNNSNCTWVTGKLPSTWSKASRRHIQDTVVYQGKIYVT